MINLLKEMWEESIGKLILILLAVIIVLSAISIHYMVKDTQEWNAFKESHNCEIVGKRKGETQVGYGMTTTGQMGAVVSSSSDQTAYLCDDGITYWR